MLEKGRAARPPMIAALAPALERAGPLWYRLLPVIRAAKPEVWSCEHSSMDRPTERIVNHLLRCVGKFGHGVTIGAGAAARTSTKLGGRDDRGVAAPRARQCSPAHPGSAEGTGSAFGPGRSRLPWLIRAELARGENVDVELETSCPESAAWSAGDVVLETVRAAGGRAPTPERPICRTSAREAHPLRGFVGSLETDHLDLLRRVVHAARHGLGDLVICFGIKVAELLRLFDGP